VHVSIALHCPLPHAHTGEGGLTMVLNVCGGVHGAAFTRLLLITTKIFPSVARRRRVNAGGEKRSPPRKRLRIEG
jgi:hypothetical protein